MADLGFSGTQLGYAERIIGVGKGRGASKKDILTALMVALDESDLQNYANNAVPDSLNIANDGIRGDSDSIGVFQQRPSQGWGNTAELMNVEVSAGKFYDALAKLPDRDAVPAAVNAQRVQRSFDPTGSNYLAKQLDAQRIMDNLYDGATLSRESSVTQNTNQNPLIMAGHIAGWLGDSKNWVRIGEFVLGALMLLFAVILIVKDSKLAKTAVKVAEKIA